MYQYKILCSFKEHDILRLLTKPLNSSNYRAYISLTTYNLPFPFLSLILRIVYYKERQIKRLLSHACSIAYLKQQRLLNFVSCVSTSITAKVDKIFHNSCCKIYSNLLPNCIIDMYCLEISVYRVIDIFYYVSLNILCRLFIVRFTFLRHSCVAQY